jgi:hypothetical protein
MSQDKPRKNNIFNDSQISDFGTFLDALKAVDVRLINEGYTIKNGKIIPPKEKTYEK